MLVQSMTELLTRGVILLLEGKCFENESVPFILEGMEDGRDRRKRRWSRCGSFGT
jgi:hypothetical protein